MLQRLILVCAAGYASSLLVGSTRTLLGGRAAAPRLSEDGSEEGTSTGILADTIFTMQDRDDGWNDVRSSIRGEIKQREQPYNDIKEMYVKPTAATLKGGWRWTRIIADEITPDDIDATRLPALPPVSLPELSSVSLPDSLPSVSLPSVSLPQVDGLKDSVRGVVVSVASVTSAGQRKREEEEAAAAALAAAEEAARLAEEEAKKGGGWKGVLIGIPAVGASVALSLSVAYNVLEPTGLPQQILAQASDLPAASAGLLTQVTQVNPSELFGSFAQQVLQEAPASTSSPLVEAVADAVSEAVSAVPVDAAADAAVDAAAAAI